MPPIEKHHEVIDQSAQSVCRSEADSLACANAAATQHARARLIRLMFGYLFIYIFTSTVFTGLFTVAAVCCAFGILVARGSRSRRRSEQLKDNADGHQAAAAAAATARNSNMQQHGVLNMINARARVRVVVV